MRYILEKYFRPKFCFEVLQLQYLANMIAVVLRKLTS